MVQGRKTCSGGEDKDMARDAYKVLVDSETDETQLGSKDEGTFYGL